MHTTALIDPITILTDGNLTDPNDYIYTDIHRKLDCGENAKYWEPRWEQTPILDISNDWRGFFNFFKRKIG